MNIVSLGRRTDLMFARWSGEVEDRGEYVVVRTLSNPGYHWGNYLIYRAPPVAGDYDRWLATFEREFASQVQQMSHRLFAWDTVTAEAIGNANDFVDHGLRLETAWVLTAKTVKPPPHLNSEIAVRRINTDGDWREVIEQQVLARPAEHSLDGYRAFKESQFKNYRQMSESGFGGWYGAFLDGQLVGDLGIFHQDGVARFQAVTTRPECRRRGICGTLVYQAATLLAASTKIESFVMEADPEYHAARIYESVGFQRCEVNHALYWHNGMSPMK